MGRFRVFAVVLVLVLLIVFAVIGVPFLYTYFVYLYAGRRMQDLRVAYYNGEGSWYADNIMIPNLVEWMGCEFTTIRGSDIQAGRLTEFDVLIIPGGHYPDYWNEIDLAGKAQILDFVTNGGGYLGICSGAYYACDLIVYTGDPAFPPPYYRPEGGENNLDLFPGVAWGPIDEITDAFEIGYAMPQINIVDHTHPITDSLPATYQILYAGGPYIQPHDYTTDYTILGTYDLTGDPAIVACNYGTGRVFLIGPHPEVEEQSDRDGWEYPPQYLPEPYDPESEWPLLFEAMKWLGKVTPLEPIPSLTLNKYWLEYRMVSLVTIRNKGTQLEIV